MAPKAWHIWQVWPQLFQIPGAITCFKMFGISELGDCALVSRLRPSLSAWWDWRLALMQHEGFWAASHVSSTSLQGLSLLTYPDLQASCTLRARSSELGQQVKLREQFNSKTYLTTCFVYVYGHVWLADNIPCLYMCAAAAAAAAAALQAPASCSAPHSTVPSTTIHQQRSQGPW